MTDYSLKQLEESDIEATAAMQHEAWHQYYSQYPDLYALIKSSSSLEDIQNDLKTFTGNQQNNSMVTGDDGLAYIVLHSGKPVGVGAVSAYKHGVPVWKPVDDYIKHDDGSLPRLAKYQSLYVDADYRGKGIGHYLNIARADYMLGKGYTGIFLAPFADATKTMAFHAKNNLYHVCDYMSLSTYGADHQRVKIACFVNTDLAGMRDHWQKQLDEKLSAGKAVPVSI